MKNAKIYINSTTDTETAYGVFFTDVAITALMTPAPKKAYITNKSATLPGKQVQPTAPKVDERDVQLTFGLHAPSLAQFLMRYYAFCAELEKGHIDLTVHIYEDSSWMKITYRLCYLSCQQYSEFNGRLAKFVLKFNEPDPSNRIVTTSTDIALSDAAACGAGRVRVVMLKKESGESFATFSASVPRPVAVILRYIEV